MPPTAMRRRVRGAARGDRRRRRDRGRARRRSCREAPDNIAAEMRHGDAATAEAAFARAAHVVALDLVNQRVAPVSMEPRSVLAAFDRGERPADGAHEHPDADRGARRARRRAARPRRGAGARRSSATSAAASA